MTSDLPRSEPLQGIYNDLCRGWAMDAINREQSLELMFLAWWHWAEPDFLTGLCYDPDAEPIWRMLIEDFGAINSDDAEFLFVAGIMLEVTPEAFAGDEGSAKELAKRMQARAAELQPRGFPPGYFDESREYGEYFAHQGRLWHGWIQA